MIKRTRPPEALRARLLAAAAHEPATPPGTWARRAVMSGAVGAGWVVGMTALLGLRRDWPQLPAEGITTTLIVLMGAASLACAAGLGRGRAMVGATSETLLAVVACLPVLLVVVISAIDPRGPSTQPSTGAGISAQLAGAIKCDLVVIAVASPLVGLGWATSRGLTLARPVLSGACLGLGAASWAHAVVRVHCPVAGAGHALIGHLLPAIPAMLLAACLFGLSARSAGKRAPVEGATDVR